MNLIIGVLVLLVLLFCLSKFQAVSKVKSYIYLSCMWMLPCLLAFYDGYFITSISIALLFYADFYP